MTITQASNGDRCQAETHQGDTNPGGAPAGNENSMRHGLRAGKLPRGCAYIERACNELRQQLESAVLGVKGEVSILDAACVNTAIKWERHGQLAGRWLRKHFDELSAADRLRFSGEVAKASESRDRCIRLLGLDRDARQSIIDTLYGRLPAPNGGQ